MTADQLIKWIAEAQAEIVRIRPHGVIQVHEIGLMIIIHDHGHAIERLVGWIEMTSARINPLLAAVKRARMELR